MCQTLVRLDLKRHLHQFAKGQANTLSSLWIRRCRLGTQICHDLAQKLLTGLPTEFSDSTCCRLQKRSVSQTFQLKMDSYFLLIDLRTRKKQDDLADKLRKNFPNCCGSVSICMKYSCKNIPVRGVLCTNAFQMCAEDCRTTFTASWRARYNADKILSLRSAPKTSTNARRDDSAIAVSATSSSSSISALPLIPETLNRSSPTRVMDDCYEVLYKNPINASR